jgi:hypothetical protein
LVTWGTRMPLLVLVLEERALDLDVEDDVDMGGSD